MRTPKLLLATMIVSVLTTLIAGTPSSAQSTSISGIVNIYTPVVAIDSCATTVTAGRSDGFGIGDTVMIIQMKGAVIDTTDTPRFGTINSYGNAGNYEFGIIASITANAITLRNALLNNYTPAGLVQLIRVPHYRNASVDATLTAAPWDGTVGGVLVIDVADTLTLNAGIDVRGSGFRGGRVSQPSTGRSREGYRYTFFSSGFGGEKGEGIAISGIGYQAGRGALANGGGGGNDHNAGGGGGGNAGVGGIGGNQYSGFGSDPIGGIGGYPLTYPNPGRKVFMGGGGGGGQQNQGVSTRGTGGGGIVIIRAGNIVGNNRTIDASGLDQDTVAGYDGAGGGGAGGTVLLDIGGVTTRVFVTARGGKGGDNNDNFLSDCVGTGGGGGGGVLWVRGVSTTLSITVNVNGGGSGLVVNQSPCVGTSYGAAAGSLGSVLDNLVLPWSAIPPGSAPANAGPDQTICAGESVTLAASGGVTYRWSADATLSCTDCALPVATPVNTTTYVVTVIDARGCTGTDSVTIAVIPCGDTTTDLSYYLPIICAGHTQRAEIGFFNRYRMDTAVAISFSGSFAGEFSLDTTLPFALTPSMLIRIPVIHRGIRPGRHTAIMRITGSSGTTYAINLIVTIDEPIAPVLDLAAIRLGNRTGSFDTCITVRSTYYTRMTFDGSAWASNSRVFSLSNRLPFLVSVGETAQLCLHVEGATASSADTLYLSGTVIDSCGIGRCVLQRIAIDMRSGLPTLGVEEEMRAAAGVVCVPNPLHGGAEIRFMLQRSGRVRVRVVDVLGREVAVLAEGEMGAGMHRVELDGSELSSGKYFVEVEEWRERRVVGIEKMR